MIKSFERIKKQNKERIKVPRTVQDTIPVDTIYKDGIFRMGNKLLITKLIVNTVSKLNCTHN